MFFATRARLFSSKMFLASCLLIPCFFYIHVRVLGTVEAKKLAKVLLFFDMTKYFCKKMAFFFIFFDFAMFV